MRRLFEPVPIGRGKLFFEGRDPAGQFLDEPIEQRGEIRVSAKTGVKRAVLVDGAFIGEAPCIERQLSL